MSVGPTWFSVTLMQTVWTTLARTPAIAEKALRMSLAWDQEEPSARTKRPQVQASFDFGFCSYPEPQTSCFALYFGINVYIILIL